MASLSVPAASSAAAAVVAKAPRRPRHDAARVVSFRLAPKPKLPLFSSKVSRLSRSTNKSSAVMNALPKEVVGGASNDSASVGRKPDELSCSEGKDAEVPTKKAAAPVSEEAMSEFMAQVASLVKLVDSRDIVELQLKQLDCEVTIRKKEALPQPPAPAPVVMMHSPMPPAAMSPQFSPPSPPPTPAASAPAGRAAPPAPLAPAAATKPAKSSHPPLKSPMSGTFYRSSGPGQPPFVKVGDKVNKGQVLCIIEAMKLMNEIEADQAGTVVEILAEDAKPVGVEQPLFIIEP